MYFVLLYWRSVSGPVRMFSVPWKLMISGRTQIRQPLFVSMRGLKEQSEEPKKIF
jgi:hypothetical protein